MQRDEQDRSRVVGREDQEGEGQGQVEGHDRVQHRELGDFGMSIHSGDTETFDC